MHGVEGGPISEGVAVSAVRGVGRGRWRLGKAVVWSPPSKDQVGFRQTHSGNIDRCSCRGSPRTNGCCATAIRAGGMPLEPGRRKSRWRQTPATAEPRRGSLGHAPPDSPRLTRPAPTNREEEPVEKNFDPQKQAQDLAGKPSNLELTLIQREMLPTNSGEEAIVSSVFRGFMAQVRLSRRGNPAYHNDGQGTPVVH